MLLRCVEDAERARIDSPEFLGVFGLSRTCAAGDIWNAVAERLDRAVLRELYTALCNALASGTPFDP